MFLLLKVNLMFRIKIYNIHSSSISSASLNNPAARNTDHVSAIEDAEETLIITIKLVNHGL